MYRSHNDVLWSFSSVDWVHITPTFPPSNGVASFSWVRTHVTLSLEQTAGFPHQWLEFGVNESKLLLALGQWLPLSLER